MYLNIEKEIEKKLSQNILCFAYREDKSGNQWSPGWKTCCEWEHQHLFPEIWAVKAEYIRGCRTTIFRMHLLILNSFLAILLLEIESSACQTSSIITNASWF